MQLKLGEKETPKLYLQESVLHSTINQFDGKAARQFLKFSRASFSYPSEKFNQWALGFEIADKNTKGVLYPTRLGLVLFGENVEEIFPHTLFKVEVCYNKDDSEIKDFGGPIVSQLSPILNYIKEKALKLTIDRRKGKREEKIDFPIEVLREAISNAIIHRDYENEKATNYLLSGVCTCRIRLIDLYSTGSCKTPCSIIL